MPLSERQNLSPAMIAIFTLGQGKTVNSPLQVSSITSAIASATWHEPHLILGQKNAKPSFSLIGQGKITADSLTSIRKGPTPHHPR